MVPTSATAHTCGTQALVVLSPAREKGCLMGQAERERFGANLRRAREAMGLSQKDFAKLVSMRQSDISTFETGKANPTIDVMARLAAAVGKDIHELLAPNL